MFFSLVQMRAATGERPTATATCTTTPASRVMSGWGALPLLRTIFVAMFRPWVRQKIRLKLLRVGGVDKKREKNGMPFFALTAQCRAKKIDIKIPITSNASDWEQGTILEELEKQLA